RRAGADKLEPLTLLQAAVAVHQAGDAAEEERAWRPLEARAGRDGVVLGSKTVGLNELRGEIDRMPRGGGAGREWRVFRGDPTRPAPGPGGHPSPEPPWRAGTPH